MGIPAVSIIIPTLNEEKYLPLLLESLRSVSTPLDVIVVDGASEDDTVKVVRECTPLFSNGSSLTLIQSAERGISLQRNLGAEIAKHDILLFCDADVVFPSAPFFNNLISEFISKGYAVATPLLVPLEKGIHLGLLFHLLSPLQRMMMFLGKPYFPGACIVTTKKVFAQIGGFDTAILLAEDVDYSMRAAKVGRAGLVNLKLPVSARRIIKYGYGWLFAEIPNVFQLLLTGRINPHTIFYPFGGYGGQKAHHVTSNTGKKTENRSRE